MNGKRWLAAIATVGLLVPVGAVAQSREPATLVSDRPGLGDGAHVLGAGVWQAELGGTIEAAPHDEYLVGSSLLRVGFEALELRVFLPSVLLLHQEDFLQLGDVGVGVKVPVSLGGAGWTWAATGTFTVPTGADGVSAEDPGLGGALIGETTLPGGVGFAFNAGYGFLFGDVGGGTFSLLATPSFAVPGREGMAFYAGYAGFFRAGDDAHLIEWGLTRLDGTERQWDVNAGYDPGGHTWFLGVGLAQRRR